MLGTGALLSFIFHVGTKEDTSASESDNERIRPSSSQEALSRPVFQWKHWLKEPSFYQVSPESVLGNSLLSQKVSPPFSHSLFLLIIFKAKVSAASWFQLLRFQVLLLLYVICFGLYV